MMFERPSMTNVFDRRSRSLPIDVKVAPEAERLDGDSASAKTAE
jgi:hypothetical protein